MVDSSKLARFVFMVISLSFIDSVVNSTPFYIRITVRRKLLGGIKKIFLAWTLGNRWFNRLIQNLIGMVLFQAQKPIL